MSFYLSGHQPICSTILFSLCPSIPLSLCHSLKKFTIPWQHPKDKILSEWSKTSSTSEHKKTEQGNLHIHNFSFNSIHSYPSPTSHTHLPYLHSHLLIFWEMSMHISWCVSHENSRRNAEKRSRKKNSPVSVAFFINFCFFSSTRNFNEWMEKWALELLAISRTFYDLNCCFFSLERIGIAIAVL